MWWKLVLETTVRNFWQTIFHLLNVIKSCIIFKAIHAYLPSLIDIGMSKYFVNIPFLCVLYIPGNWHCLSISLLMMMIMMMMIIGKCFGSSAQSKHFDIFFYTSVTEHVQNLKIQRKRDRDYTSNWALAFKNIFWHCNEEKYQDKRKWKSILTCDFLFFFLFTKRWAMQYLS